MRAQENLGVTVTNAIEFLRGSNEPHALLWLAVMHRQSASRNSPTPCDDSTLC